MLPILLSQKIVTDYRQEIDYPHYNIIGHLNTSDVHTHAYFSLQTSSSEWQFTRKLEVENHNHKVYCTITCTDLITSIPKCWHF